MSPAFAAWSLWPLLLLGDVEDLGWRGDVYLLGFIEGRLGSGSFSRYDPKETLVHLIGEPAGPTDAYEESTGYA